MLMTCLVIGAGGHARVVADTLTVLNPRIQIVLLDDEYPELRESGDFVVLDKPSNLVLFRDRYSVGYAALGNARDRLEHLRLLSRSGLKSPPLVHPSSWVSPRAALGFGTVVLAGAVVQAGAIVGSGCIINTSASVDHDCHLSDGVHIAPGAHIAGGVKIGSRSWIGIGSVVKEYVSIGDDVMVGAGSAVINNVCDGQTVVGVPARPLAIDDESEDT